jgi:hypothetical protein
VLAAYVSRYQKSILKNSQDQIPSGLDPSPPSKDRATTALVEPTPTPSLPWRSPRRLRSHAAIGLCRGVALRKRKRRRRESRHKRKRRKREGELSLRDFGLDVCAASSRRWLEKRRRAGIAAVRPQFPLTRLHGRPGLVKKSVPTESSRCWMDRRDGSERREWVNMRDGRRYFRREWADRRVFDLHAQLFQNFRARMNNSTSCLFLVPAVLSDSRHKK